MDYGKQISPVNLEAAQAIISGLNLCYLLHNQIPYSQWCEECEAALSSLDSVALEDPELATYITYIHRETYFFYSVLPPDYVYIGHGIALKPGDKDKYNTPQKRARYIEDFYAAHKPQYPYYSPPEYDET